ncbi:MAG: hypothetical protein JXR77_02660, partial [Lentisphaeria bacterium]|nr:hypothetical protein [Lentisphaeria bacterium]
MERITAGGRLPLLAALVALSTGWRAAAAAPWAQALSYDGGGTWRTRVPVTVRNPARRSLYGAPLRVPVSREDGTGALIGQAVAGLRVAGANGVEYLFDLEDARGLPKREGLLAEGDTITVPAETSDAAEAGVTAIATADAGDAAAAAPQARQEDAEIALFLYSGNEQAWLPPEWLGTRLSNLGFEAGEEAPASWTVSGVDDSHRMIWQSGGARGGTRCARCEVDEGAAPAWVKYMQGGMPVVPGQRLRCTAWVKGAGVKGRAGWYVHVDGDRPQVVNRSESRDGTFDWQQIVIEFEVPPGGRLLSLGTLLHGTGTAWFDDAAIESVEGGQELEVRVGPAETRALAVIGHDAAWPTDGAWLWRAPIPVRNPSGEAVAGALIRIASERLANRVAKAVGFGVDPSIRLVDPRTPSRALDVAGDLVGGLYAAADLPPACELVLWLYLSPDPDLPGASRRVALPDWVASPANLARNGAMEVVEEGRPAAWVPREEGAEGERRFTARVVETGQGGGRCLELDVPRDLADPGWTGWRQMVPVKPGMRYLLSGSIRTRGVDGSAKIHGHFRKADGTHANAPFFGTTTTASGDSDWTATEVTVTTPPDCAFIEIHLTMNARGTLWHDNVLLAQVGEGLAGEPQTRLEARGDLDAWAVNPLVKVFRQDVFPRLPERRIRTGVPRHAWKAVQMALRSGTARHVQVRVEPLRGPGDAELPAPVPYRVGYIPIDFPMGYASSRAPGYHRLLPKGRGSDGWADWWPDPLIPLDADGGLSLEPDTTQPIWVDCFAPAEAVPGVYRGRIEIRDGGRTLEVPLEVTVWNLTMPKRRHLPALYDLRRGRGEDPFAAADVAAWHRFLARYNVSPAMVHASPEFTLRDGRVTMETAAFDRECALLFDELEVGKVYTPNRWFYACGWAYPPKKIFGLEPFTPEYVS